MYIRFAVLADRFAEAATYLDALSGEYLPKQDKPDETLLKQAVIDHLGKLRVLYTLDVFGHEGVCIVPRGTIPMAPEEIHKEIEGGNIRSELLPAIIEASARRLKNEQVKGH